MMSIYVPHLEDDFNEGYGTVGGALQSAFIFDSRETRRGGAALFYQ